MTSLAAFLFLGILAVASCDCDHHTCMRTQTCCPGNEPGEYGCCPHFNAVCCEDGQFCCPADTVCDETSGGCLPEEQAASRTLRKRVSLPEMETEPSAAKVADVTEDKAGVHRCDENFYCAEDSSCCPLPSGLASGNDEKTDELSSRSLPLGINGGDNFCPSDTKGNSNVLSYPPVGLHFHQGAMSRRTGDFESESEVTTPSKEENVSIIVCPVERPGQKEFYCPGGSSCCMDTSERYTCCPFPEANCCYDMIHCCARFEYCDVTSTRCIGPHGMYATVKTVLAQPIQ